MSAGRSMHGLPHHHSHARSLPRSRWVTPPRLFVVAVAVAAAASVSIPAAAQAAQSSQSAQFSPRLAASASALVPVAGAPKLPRGSHVVGTVAGTAELTGAVALKLPDPAAVTAFIDEVSS